MCVKSVTRPFLYTAFGSDIKLFIQVQGPMFLIFSLSTILIIWISMENLNIFCPIIAVELKTIWTALFLSLTYPLLVQRAGAEVCQSFCRRAKECPINKIWLSRTLIILYSSEMISRITLQLTRCF